MMNQRCRGHVIHTQHRIEILPPRKKRTIAFLKAALIIEAYTARTNKKFMALEPVRGGIGEASVQCDAAASAFLKMAQQRPDSICIINAKNSFHRNIFRRLIGYQYYFNPFCSEQFESTRNKRRRASDEHHHIDLFCREIIVRQRGTVDFYRCVFLSRQLCPDARPRFSAPDGGCAVIRLGNHWNSHIFQLLCHIGEIMNI